MKGKPRCTLQINPTDATELRIEDGGQVTVRSRVGEVVADVEVTDIVMPGVVSLPHGWGHGRPVPAWRSPPVMRGSIRTCLTDPLALDPLSGTSVLNGIPVEVVPA